ncbi:hypothetical protein D3C80_1379090 [compost metagenome]
MIMKIALKNKQTGLFVKHLRMAANHVNSIEYTDDIQEAFLYDKELYTKNEFGKNESWIGYQLRWCREKHNQLIEPVDVNVSLA